MLCTTLNINESCVDRDKELMNTEKKKKDEKSKIWWEEGTFKYEWNVQKVEIFHASTRSWAEETKRFDSTALFFRLKKQIRCFDAILYQIPFWNIQVKTWFATTSKGKRLTARCCHQRWSRVASWSGVPRRGTRLQRWSGRWRRLRRKQRTSWGCCAPSGASSLGSRRGRQRRWLQPFRRNLQESLREEEGERKTVWWRK